MTVKLIHAEYLENYKIAVRFSDGKSGVVDLEGELWGEVFEPLRDIAEFRKLKFDPELKTVVWPNGADIAPEYIQEHVQESV